MGTLDNALAWIDAQTPAMLGRVVDWCSINSYTHHLPGLARMADRLLADFAALGGAEEKLEVGAEESIDATGRAVRVPLGPAIRIRKRMDAPRRIMLGIHMDTVYPPEDAFQAVTRTGENTLRGPGVADAKGGLAVMLTALQAFERIAEGGHGAEEDTREARGLGWEVVINPDEEIGSPGSMPLFEEAAKRNRAGLLFEPAYHGGGLVVERKGSGNFTMVIRGKAAHVGRDHALGRNALHAAAEVAAELSRSWPTKWKDRGVLVNVGKIDGGGPVNVVPDLAVLRLNVRADDPEGQRDIEAELHRLTDEVARREGFSAVLHGKFFAPPKLLDEPTRKLLSYADAAAERLGLKLGRAKSGGVSDGNRLAAAGLPNLDSLGVRGANIHSDREHMEIDSLAERAKLTLLVLWKLAGEEDRV